MDSLRVTKVEKVLCTKAGSAFVGTIHLTAHHLIFRYDEGKEDETWVPYPLISLVQRLPQTIQGSSPLTFHCRTFESFIFSFAQETDCVDVFESVKELTVATSVNQLYAFFYSPNPPLPTNDGWSIYSPREEFMRMGVGSRTKAWRFTDINKDYSFAPTYPARMVVPTKISDSTLQYACKYRSKARIPALSYLHWANYGSITRSSQPMVGLTQNRSIQDEKLIEAIFHSHHSPETRVSNALIYGSTTTNLIIDARPTTNAVANTAKGAGTENMDNYKESKKAYLGIDNIHVMRDSLSKVVEALREVDTLSANASVEDLGEEVNQPVLDRQALRRSGWLRHMSTILEGTSIITRNVHVNNSHVLIHCSDGWDRTSQLSAIAQLCLDPFYRTIRGFEILIEKDWVSFGHKFMDRSGHLSSDKFFLSPNEPSANGGGGAEAAQAFLASMQNRFASNNHIKETSPVFHQFLETVRQIQRQFPDRFQFNERFLQKLYYHLYSCQFGTFLFDTERERRVASDGGAPPCERTLSVWDFMNSPKEMELNTNPTFDATLDDPKSREPKADMGVLFPNPKDVRFWNELYGRTDEEMNGRIVQPQMEKVELVGPIESAAEDPVLRVGTPSGVPLPPSPVTSPPPPSPSKGLMPLPASRPEFLRQSTEDSFKPFPSTGSSFSMRPAVSTEGRPASPGSPPSSSSTPTTPNRPRQSTQGDALSTGGGMKSVWGKLSSNASAALSVVQEAYVGVAKDFNKTVTSPTGSREGELVEKPSVYEHSAGGTGRDTLNAWGDAIGPSSSTRPAFSSATVNSNPWATVKPRASVPAQSTDNPWNTVRTTSQRNPMPLANTFETSLPIDPGVSRPAMVSRASSSAIGASIPRPQAPAPPADSKRPLKESVDPLGVGLL